MKWIKSKSVYLLISLIILLLGIIAILLKTDIWRSIGTSLVAGGVISLLFVWHQYIEEREIESTYNISKAGLIHIYPKRDIDKYDELITTFSKRLDIAGYSLRGFFESFKDVIIEKVKNDSTLRIRIIVVDPDAMFSKNREKLEKYAEGTFKNSIDTIISDFSAYSNIEIRKISFELPSMIFRIDNVMFIGPYLFKKPSKSTVTFEIKEDGWLFKTFEKEFDKLWNS